MSNDTGTHKKSRFAKIGNWGARKLRSESNQKASRNALHGGFKEATSLLAPNRLNGEDALAGLKGRYRDDGRSRFASMCRSMGLREEDLQMREMENKRQAGLCLMTGVGLFCLGVIIGFFLPNSGTTATLLCFMATVFLLLSIKHDYSAWQISMRAFPSLRSYFSSRWKRLPKHG